MRRIATNVSADISHSILLNFSQTAIPVTRLVS